MKIFSLDIIAVYDSHVEFIEVTGTDKDKFFIRADRLQFWIIQDVTIYSVLFRFDEIRRLGAASILFLLKRQKVRGLF
jgi:hypothetical protein